MFYAAINHSPTRLHWWRFCGIRHVDQYQYNMVYGYAVAQLSAECKRGDQEGVYES